MSKHICRCKHDMSRGRIPEINLTEEEYALEYMVYQTTRFGVEISEPETEKHIIHTPSFNVWYSFYNNDFKNILPDKECHTFRKAEEEGEDVFMFMPKGDWRDLLKKDKSKVKIK